jgi:hypothetical protein
MVDKVIVGGVPARMFLMEIETLLREGRADEAADRLKGMLGGLCGEGLPLPGRFLTVRPQDVGIAGWEALPERIEEYDRRGAPITAIGIDFSWPGHQGRKPDENGWLDPHIETNFYCDGEEWPFSSCDRAGLLACYQRPGATWLGSPKWQGQFEELDNTISVEGIGDLYGAVYRVSATYPRRDAEEQARVVGACYVVVLVYLAVRDFAPREILPRPMAVIVGSNEDYPLFTAPVFAAR